MVTVSFSSEGFQVIVYDRGGVSLSPQYSINDNLIQFLKFMVGLSFGDDTALGYSPSITLESGTPPCYMSMQAPLNAEPGSETFNIKNVLYISESGLGCGSTLWLISWGGRYFIAKDIWHDTHHAYTEGKIL